MFVLWLFYVIGNSSQSELAYNIKKALRANDAQLAKTIILLRKLLARGKVYVAQSDRKS